MSKDRAKNRAAREHEAAIRTAAKAAAEEHRERLVSMRLDAERSGPREAITPKTHHKAPAKPAAKAPRKAAPAAAAKAAPAARKTNSSAKSTAKPSTARAQNGKKRGHKPVGRPDGPLARRRRLRVRLLLVLLLAVNVAVGIIWRDWEVTLAALIITAITAPLLAALLLRRRR